MAPIPTIGSQKSTRASSEPPPLSRPERQTDTNIALNSIEHLDWELEQMVLDNLKLYARLQDARTALRESQAASRRTVQAHEKRLREAGLKISAAARVFAIPELLDHILLELDLHQKEPFRISHVSNAMQLCRLERVNHAFYSTLRDTSQFRLPKQDLRISGIPSDHAAVIWLLRELGHSGFSEANCESFGCAAFNSDRNRLEYSHTCQDGGIHVKHSPDYSTAITYKAQFDVALKLDKSWRSMTVGKSLMVYFEERGTTYCRAHCRVSSSNSTLGELWDRYRSLL